MLNFLNQNRTISGRVFAPASLPSSRASSSLRMLKTFSTREVGTWMKPNLPALSSHSTSFLRALLARRLNENCSLSAISTMPASTSSSSLRVLVTLLELETGVGLSSSMVRVGAKVILLFKSPLRHCKHLSGTSLSACNRQACCLYARHSFAPSMQTDRLQYIASGRRLFSRPGEKHS